MIKSVSCKLNPCTCILLADEMNFTMSFGFNPMRSFLSNPLQEYVALKYAHVSSSYFSFSPCLLCSLLHLFTTIFPRCSCVLRSSNPQSVPFPTTNSHQIPIESKSSPIQTNPNVRRLCNS